MSTRRQFRQDVVARLKASSALTAIVPASRIEDSRSTRVPVSAMPSVVVYTTQSRRTLKTAGVVPLVTTKHTVAVDCFASAASDSAAMEAADLLAEAVLDALLTEPNSSGTYFLATVEGLQEIDETLGMDSDADGRFAASRLSFDVVVSECFEPAPAVPLEEVHVDLDVDGDGVADDPDDLELTVTGLET